LSAPYTLTNILLPALVVGVPAVQVPPDIPWTIPEYSSDPEISPTL